MNKQLLLAILLGMAVQGWASTFVREVPTRQYGKEAGMLLDLGKISLGTLNDVEEKKQYLSTVQLEKQRIQNYTLRMVYENAYQLYKQGDYQRAQELAQTILSIDPNFKQAQTLAKQANHMGTYGTTSEAQVIDSKFKEAAALYDSGRLVEANDKLNEILTIQPGNAKAQSWKRQIDVEIAKEYARRGNVAEKSGDYQAALDAWYNALLMRKDDPALLAKISEAETKLRQQQLQENMKLALELYNKGQYVESYAVFERIKKIQPGDQRVQKYMSQLKNEIAGGYYTAGCQAYSAYRFDQAVSYWNNAKKWGADTVAMDNMIKQARTAKERYIRNQELRAKQLELEAQQAAQREVEKAKAQAEAALHKAEEETIETITVDNTIPGVTTPIIPMPGTTTTTTTTTTTVTNEGMPGMGSVIPSLPGGITRVSAEQQAAAKAKYVEGLNAYNQDDFERARQAWMEARQLDPGNLDVEMGLRKVEELMMIK
jgi:tetratricopeptide (TPR) repeat protein